MHMQLCARTVFPLIACVSHAHYLSRINDVCECAAVVVVVAAERSVLIVRVMPLTFEFMRIWKRGRSVFRGEMMIK